MALKGAFLYHLDKTTCGGRIIAGAPDETYEIGGIVRQQAREGDPVTCGAHEGRFRICGGMGDTYSVDGVIKEWAGSIESYSSCPCRARFVPSVSTHTYDYNCNTGLAAIREETRRKEKLIEAKKEGLEPLTLPVMIYKTIRHMNDYQASDMHYGDMDILSLRNRMRINVDNVSARVNPCTLELKPEPSTATLYSPYAMQNLDKHMSFVSRNESADIMFDEFRELAKTYSFHGPYKNVITEMITHMQENSGTPYSNPLLDKALKEQILSDHSERSSLLVIKDFIRRTINYEYGFIALENKSDFFDENNNLNEIRNTILPKFDRLIDRINGLGIAIHDTWATHITLESVKLSGDSYQARVNYRVQDHFGLDEADIQHKVFRQFRIFRLWFVLQRWQEYGYKPFITEMNATLEISGEQSE